MWEDVRGRCRGPASSLDVDAENTVRVRVRGQIEQHANFTVSRTRSSRLHARRRLIRRRKRIVRGDFFKKNFRFFNHEPAIIRQDSERTSFRRVLFVMKSIRELFLDRFRNYITLPHPLSHRYFYLKQTKKPFNLHSYLRARFIVPNVRTKTLYRLKNTPPKKKKIPKKKKKTTAQ